MAELRKHKIYKCEDFRKLVPKEYQEDFEDIVEIIAYNLVGDETAALIGDVEIIGQKAGKKPDEIWCGGFITRGPGSLLHYDVGAIFYPYPYWCVDIWAFTLIEHMFKDYVFGHGIYGQVKGCNIGELDLGLAEFGFDKMEDILTMDNRELFKYILNTAEALYDRRVSELLFWLWVEKWWR